MLTLVENIAKKNYSRFPIAVLFYQPDIQSLNDCKFVFLDLPSKYLGRMGLLIDFYKGLENTFPTVYYMPPKC
jgi:hypothetical protein